VRHSVRFPFSRTGREQGDFRESFAQKGWFPPYEEGERVMGVVIVPLTLDPFA
jgi:hypothetical protein